MKEPHEICDDELAAVWPLRFADPAAFAAAVDSLPTGAGRDLAEGFLAWRRRDYDEALRRTAPLLDDTHLSPLLRLRAHATHGAVLTEVGLPDEAAQCLLAALPLADLSGSSLRRIGLEHDLGVIYVDTDPTLALDHFTKAERAARRLLDAPDPEGREAHSLVALSIFNIVELTGHHDLALPDPHHTLEHAEALAQIGRPELAHALRGARIMAALDEDDLATAEELARDLPDPSDLRDFSDAVYVVRARAALASAHGEHQHAVRLLRTVVGATPKTYHAELLDDLGRAQEHAGDLAGALHSARSLVQLMRADHTDASRRAVRALEVLHRTDEAGRAADDARQLAARLGEQLEEIARDRERLRDHVRRDVLTGLWNRRHLLDTTHALTGDGHQVAVIDIDGFKQVNDVYGHTAGDHVLRRLANALQDVSGPHDTCVRHGGDEFVVVRTAGDPSDLARDLEAVTSLAGLAELAIPAVRTSIGVARSSTTGTTPGAAPGLDDALTRADALMYAAKRAGGARVQTE